MSSNNIILFIGILKVCFSTNPGSAQVIFPSSHQDANRFTNPNYQLTSHPPIRFAPSNPIDTDIPIVLSERNIHSGVSFRSRSKPQCKRNNDNEPCLHDPEYDPFIQQRFQSILEGSNLNNIIQDQVYQSLLIDANENETFKLNNKQATTRFGFNVEESPARVSKDTIIYPQRAKTVQDEWAFILNQGPVKQGVKVEKCISEGGSCDIGGGAASTIKTACRQKYIYRKMLVLDNLGTNIVPESVIMPSCCVCYITRSEENLAPRIQNTTTTNASNSPVFFAQDRGQPISPPRSLHRSPHRGNIQAIRPVFRQLQHNPYTQPSFRNG